MRTITVDRAAWTTERDLNGDKYETRIEIDGLAHIVTIEQVWHVRVRRHRSMRDLGIQCKTAEEAMMAMER